MLAIVFLEGKCCAILSCSHVLLLHMIEVFNEQQHDDDDDDDVYIRIYCIRHSADYNSRKKMKLSCR